MAIATVPLVLASASPRRRELLASMGCVFSVQSADIDESQRSGEAADDYVVRLSQDKASAIACHKDASFAVLAADTIVVQGETVFSKPRDRQHAFQIWRQLANSKHHVITAVCLVFRDKVATRTVRTMVEFGAIDEQQMHHYWQSGEPRDKAGAYAIQGRASAWVKLIYGSYSNVVGLPLRETNMLLKTVGHNWL